MLFIQAILRRETVLAVAALAALATWLAPFSSVFDLFRHTWPVWFASACMAFTIAAAHRRWRTAALAIGLGIVIALPAWTGFALSRPEAHADGGDVRLRLVTHNIFGRGGARAADIAGILAASTPDLIALQEVWNSGPDVVAALQADYAHVSDCDGGPTRLLSRHPFVDAGCLPGWMPRYRLPGLKVNPAAWGEIELPTGERVLVIAVHLPWPSPLNAQEEQMARLTEFLASRPTDRAIVLGDFNAAPPALILDRMERDWCLIRRTRSLPTWPAFPFELAGIDHVYAGEAWSTATIRRLPETGSDHRALEIELDLDR